MKKRMTSLLLALAMLASMVVLPVGAAQVAEVADVLYAVDSYCVQESDAYGNKTMYHYAQCVDISGREVNVLIGVEKDGNITGVHNTSATSGFYTAALHDQADAAELGVMVMTPMPTAYDADTAPYYVQSSAQGVTLTEDAQTVTGADGETLYLKPDTRYIMFSGTGSALKRACVVGGVTVQTESAVHMVLGKDELGNREVQAMFLATDPTKIVVTDCLYVSKEQTEYDSAHTDGYRFEAYSANTGEVLSINLSVPSLEQGFYTYYFDAENNVYELFPYAYEGVLQGQYLLGMYNSYMIVTDKDGYDASKAVVVDTRSEEELESSDYGQVTTLTELGDLMVDDCVSKLDLYVNTESKTVQTIFITQIIPPVVPALDNALLVVCSYSMEQNDEYGGEIISHYAQCVDMSGSEVNVLVGVEKYGELTGVSSVDNGFYYIDRVDSRVEEELGIQTLTPMPTAYDADIAPYYVQSSEQGVTLTKDAQSITTVDGEVVYLTEETQYFSVSGEKAALEITSYQNGVSGSFKVSVVLTERSGNPCAAVVWLSPVGSVDKVAFYGANLVLGTTLDMNFYYATTNVTDGNSYAKVVRSYADGRADDVRNIPMSQWQTSGEYYKIVYDGLAAKEMCDEIKITIYNSTGTAISKTWTDSIRAYVMRVVDDTDPVYVAARTMLIDMLNYGAAAQEHFGYAKDDLANNQLTDVHLSDATQSAQCEDGREMTNPDNVYGSSLELENKIVLNFYFTGVKKGMYADISYTDHDGNPVLDHADYSDFVRRGNNYKLSIDELAVADGNTLVTCTVYNSDGSVHAQVKDSMNSYLARLMPEYPWMEYVAKFISSTHDYMH